MAVFQTLFATRLYRARLSAARNRLLEKTCLGIAAEDRAGQRWAKKHGYGGYTSYASLNDLTRRASLFAELERDIARHVARFARDAEFDLSRRKLKLDSLWINVMEKGGVHAPHIHPHAVVSGTYYVAVPDHAGAIRFEDPRLAMLTAAPPRKDGREIAKPDLCQPGAKSGHASAMGKLAASRGRGQPRQAPTHLDQLQLCLSSRLARTRRPC